MAQLGARLHGMQKVEGSSPSGSMTNEGFADSDPFGSARKSIPLRGYGSVTRVEWPQRAAPGSGLAPLPARPELAAERFGRRALGHCGVHTAVGEYRSLSARRPFRLCF